ncbi:MAG: hypothetical protein IT252_11400 [Chitinophagaceae bacterium]|nr:hypothetical protein [Chitinophagaceae bacterium]
MFQKLLLILICVTVVVYAQAQNLGINKTNPQEALDVNGNIQLNGTIKVNGTAGQTGQALFSTGTGLQWLDAAANDFKRFRSFLANGTWNVPPGVTEVLIEAWGAGGGGSGGGGGGGGGYVMAIIDVTNVTQISFTVGTGGAGSNTSTGTTGGNSVVSWTEAANSRSVTAPGGNGGLNTGSGTGGSNFNANVSASTSLFELPGLPGSPIRTLYNESSSNTFITAIEGGKGGGTYKFYQNGGAGHNYSVTAANAAFILNRANNAAVPGGGGGSGYRLQNIGGNNGASGMVIIRW